MHRLEKGRKISESQVCLSVCVVCICMCAKDTYFMDMVEAGRRKYGWECFEEHVGKMCLLFISTHIGVAHSQCLKSL